MPPLVLRVRGFIDARHWRWELRGGDGAPPAFFDVSLEPSENAYDGFVDLRSYLRDRAGSQGRSASEARLIDEVGDWMGRRILGPIGPALVAEAGRGRRTVVVSAPGRAGQLLERPLELSHVDGRPLGAHGLTFVFVTSEDGDGGGGPSVGPVDRLRILAAFSLPDGSTPLSLRQERQQLTALVDRLVAGGYAVDLRILQYGVTRRELTEALAEPPGWDIIHFSGHGLAGALTLEGEGGTTEAVGAAQLSQLLRAAQPRLRLVTLSTCESAASALAQTVHLLGADLPPDLVEGAGDEESPTRVPGIARQLAQESDCAVVAMRYPVDDRFGISFISVLYEEVIARATVLPEAFARALAASQGIGLPLSAVAPTLHGGPAATLTVPLPHARPAATVAAEPAGQPLPPVSAHFVGRVAAMTRASRALAPTGTRSGVLLVGMAGAGKTACARELAELHAHRFGSLIWYQAPISYEGDQSEPDPALALGDLCGLLEVRLPGVDLWPVLHNGSTVPHGADDSELPATLTGLRRRLRDQRALVVLDNLESLLTPDGSWVDARWGPLVATLCAAGGPARAVLTSRIRPADLSPDVLVETVHALAWDESVLLARELANLGRLIRGDDPRIEPAAGRSLVIRALRIAQGHPVLIHLADRSAADPAALTAQLDGLHIADAADHLEAITDWIRQSVSTLTIAEAVAVSVLGCLEESDRRDDIAEAVWPSLWPRFFPAEAAVPPLSDAVTRLAEIGLVRVDAGASRVYWLHPTVASAVRNGVRPEVATIVDQTLAGFWVAAAQDGLREEAAGLSYLVVDAGRAAAPYLLRLGEIRVAAMMIQNAIVRDEPTMGDIGWYVSLLQRLLAVATATPDEDAVVNALATALQRVPAAVALPRLRELAGRAAVLGAGSTDFVLAAQSAVLKRASRYPEALELVEARLAVEPEPAPLTWTYADLMVGRIEALVHLSAGRSVLTEGLNLLERIDGLPTAGPAVENINVWNVVERLLEACRRAAKNSEEWELALQLNARCLAIKRQRGAPPLELARVRGNDAPSLIKLGRLTEAQAVILATKRIAEGEERHADVAKQLSDLAALEQERGRDHAARDLQVEALRLKYLTPEPETIAVSHGNLGVHQHSLAQPYDGFCHQWAALMIYYLIGSGRADAQLNVVAWFMAAFPPGDPTLPSTLDQIRAQVDRGDGVRFGRLMEDLAGPPDRAQSAFDAVGQLLAEPLVTNREAMAEAVQMFEPVLRLAVVAQVDPRAAVAFDLCAAVFEYVPERRHLGGALRRLIEEGSEGDFDAGLVGVDRAITGALRARIRDGGATMDTQSAILGANELVNGGIADFERIVNGFNPLVVAAAMVGAGIATAPAQLEQELAGLAGTDWAKLAPRVRSVVADAYDGTVFAGLDALDRAVLRRVISAFHAGRSRSAGPDGQSHDPA